MGHEQLPVIGKLDLFSRFLQRRERRTGGEQVVLSEMAGKVRMDLDETTQLRLETLIEERPTTNVWLMGIGEWGAEKQHYYSVCQDYMGNRGGRAYRGKVIEGVRVRFLGPTRDQIEKISYGKFVRRIPTVCEFFTYGFGAYQVVAEDETYTVYELDKDELYAMRHKESGVLFSDGIYTHYNRIASRVGEKSMPQGYYGFVLSGYHIMPESKNLALNREYLKGILDLVTTHQQETADLLRQDGARNLLDKIRFLYQSIGNQKV